MPHAIWKGSISFGLVYVPVALYPASSESGIDFDWLDRRSMEPVGYKRVNKKSGREVAKEQIVKGVKVDDGKYVVLSDDEIRAAYPKTTQTIAIESFVGAAEISFTQFERPYFLEPLPKGEKVYALLREALRHAGVVGIARVVMHTKEHLAALIPNGPGLMLNTLRWADDMRPTAGLRFPAAGKGSIKPAELEMAAHLVKSMTTAWKPEAYKDQFTGAIHALVARRVKAGKTEDVEPQEAAPGAEESNVVDLTALLKQSLGKKGGGQAAPRRPAGVAAKRAKATPKVPAKRRA
ncbi:MAG: Ku protein [Caldimonas sp.]